MPVDRDRVADEFYAQRVERAEQEYERTLQKAAGGAKKVLSEEEHIGALQHLIVRDFFPDLPKLRARLEYADALDNGDVRRLTDLRRRLGTPAAGHTPSATPGPGGGLVAASRSPWGDRPGDAAGREDTTEVSVRIPEGMSLDDFLARYTSEDNASFAEIYGRMQEARRNQRWWADPDKLTRQRLKEHPEAKLLEADAAEARRLAGGEGILTTVTDTRPVHISTFDKAPSTNALFWPPEGETPKRAAVMGPPPAISHAATRLRRGGLERGDTTEGSGGKQSLLFLSGASASVTAAKDAAESPRVAGYGFVPSTPALTPGGAGESPMMTWGEVAGTPLLLPPLDVPLRPNAGDGEGTPSFTVQKAARREELSHELAEQAHKRLKSGRQGGPPSRLRAGRESTPAMSPAALKLARAVDRVRTPRGASAVDWQLRASYGLTPTRNPSRAATPNRAVGAGATPVVGKLGPL